MEIVVCIKYVTLAVPIKKIVRTPDTCVLNPFDRPALELALQMAEQRGDTVTALSMGPPNAEEALYEARALGAHKAVLLCDPALAGADTLATAKALAAAVKKLDCSLLLFGTRTADSDTGQVGPQVATLLDWPFVGSAMQIETEGDSCTARRNCDGFNETLQAQLPVAISVHPKAATPRDTALGGIEASFGSGQVTRFSLDDLGLSPDIVGATGSGTETLSMKKVKRQRKCEMIEGSAADQAQALVDRLVDTDLI
jgi:electron transfer flavoprotein beta subunit